MDSPFHSVRRWANQIIDEPDNVLMVKMNAEWIVAVIDEMEKEEARLNG